MSDNGANQPDWVDLDSADAGKKGKPFKIRGADARTIEIPAGEYYFNTKARARRMCLNSLSKEARQVYASLELGTMGFQREEAVIKVRGGEERLKTRHDIAVETGLDDRNVGRGLAELEAAKLAERRPLDPAKPLQKGNVRILCWAEPQSAPEEKRGSCATPKPDWAPDSWAPLIAYAKRYKYALPEDLGVERDLLLQDGEEVVRDLQKAIEGVERFLERVSAQSRPKVVVERTEITTERTERTERAGGLGDNAEPKAPARPPEPPSPQTPGRDPITEELSMGLEDRGYAYLLSDEQAIASLRADLGDMPIREYWPILDERLERAKRGREKIGFGILRDKARQAYSTWNRQKGTHPPTQTVDLGETRAPVLYRLR